MDRAMYFGIVGALLASLLWPAIASGEDRPDDTAAKTAEAAHASYGLSASPLSTVLTAQLANMTGKDSGNVVAYVLPGSPAEMAGRPQHDIRVTYDHYDVYSPDQLAKLFCNDRPGHEAALTYVRNGSLGKSTLTLDARPGDSIWHKTASRESRSVLRGDQAPRVLSRDSDPQILGFAPGNSQGGRTDEGFPQTPANLTARVLQPTAKPVRFRRRIV